MPFTTPYSPLDKLIVNSEKSEARYNKNKKAVFPHNGIDLKAQSPLPVYNAHNGKVIRVEYSPTYGNVVVIQDDSGYSTLYAHLSAINVNVNDRLDEKTRIGTSGNTGPDTTPFHLHFEVIKPETSNLIANGIPLGDVKGKDRDNPRPLLAEAFPESFPATIYSNDGSYDIEGDDRDNVLVGNKNNNLMRGKAGSDTYKAVNYGDTIADDDGIIYTGGKLDDNNNYVSGKLFSGNADPRKVDGQEIDGQWTLGTDYLLVRKGSDLWIMPANTDDALINDANTPHVTISGYPFDKEGPAFGVTLGKVKTDQYVQTSIRPTPLRDSALYAMNDPNGAFISFGLVNTASGNQLTRMVIGNSTGQVVSQIPLDNGADYQVFPPAAYSPNNDGKNIKIIAPFSNNAERVGVALIEASTGEVIARQVLDSSSGVNQDGHPFAVNLGQYFCLFFGNDGTNFYLHTSRTDLANAKLEARMLGFNKYSLAPAEPIIPQPGQIQNGVFGAHSGGNPTPPEITLLNGVKISRRDNELTIKTPQLEGVDPAKVPNETKVAPNNQATAQLNAAGQGKIFFVTPSPGQNGGVVNLPNVPYARIAVGGAGYGNINLNGLGINLSSLRASATQTTLDEHSLDSLLSGEYNPARRRRENDDYGDDYALEEPEDDDNEETIDPNIIGVISLKGTTPDGQNYDYQFFFPGVDEITLANEAYDYFRGVQGLTSTQAPTTTPTFEPTSSTTPVFDPTTLGVTSTTTARQIGGGNNTNINDGASSGGGIPITAIALPPVAGSIGLFGLALHYFNKWRKKNGDETRRRQREERDTRRQARAEEGRASGDNNSWTDETNETLQKQTVRLQAFEEANASEQEGYLEVRAPDTESQKGTPPSPHSVRSTDSKKLERERNSENLKTETRF